MTIFRTFTDAEREALKLHGLSTEGPSQLSDAFVLGMRYALKTPTESAIDPRTRKCRKCGGAMKPGKAMGQTVECSDEGTCSPAGPGKLIDCMKCEVCGWSVTAGAGETVALCARGVMGTAPALPRSDSKEAADGIEAVLAERNYPGSSKAAGRAGWEAAFRWLRARGVEEVPDAQA